MGGLYNWSARHISVRMPQRLHSEVWDHPPIWGVLAYVVLERIGIYVTHLQNTLAQYISTWKIFNNKVAEEKRPDLSALLRFCEKSGIGFGYGGEAERGGGGAGDRIVA